VSAMSQGGSLATREARGDAERSALCVAVLGTGSIGMRHVGVLRGMSRVNVLAVPLRPTRRQELMSAGYPTARSLDEAAGLGARLCLIATDTGRHVEDGLAAMARGMDVLVEKPLARDASEGKRLTTSAQEQQRKVFVGCVLRFSESLNVFRERVREVGTLHTVRIACQSYLPDWRPGRPYHESYSARADEGGVLRDLIHEIDYAGWIFGWPAAVHARLKNLGRLGIAAEELAELSWETSTGCLVSITLDYLSRPPCRQMKACGARGTIEWDGLVGNVRVALEGAPVNETCSSQARDAMFLAQATAFVNTAHGISDSRLATGEEGLRALAVCDAARRSSSTHQEEPVAYQ